MVKAMSKFKAADFRDNPRHQTSIPVQLPYLGYFRVNPHREGVDGIYNLVRYQDEWWLVHPEVVNNYKIPKLRKAELYEALYDDGRTILVPVTKSAPGYEDFNLSMKAIMEAAQKRWLALHKDEENSCFISNPAASNRFEDPEWVLNDSPDLLIEAAFRDRMILSVEQAKKMFTKRQALRFVSEDDDD
jgi:hypothetical protein